MILALFHPAVPVDVESEDVFVEAIFDGAVVDNEAGMDDG